MIDKVKKTFVIEATPDTMKRFERFLCFFHYNSGHSGLFAMGFDGDGHEVMTVSPAPDKKLADGMRDVAGKSVEIANDDGFSGDWLKDETDESIFSTIKKLGF